VVEPLRHRADGIGIVVVVLVTAGLLLGVLVGRWWILPAAAPVGVWIALTAEIEAVPGWYLGLVYAGLSGLGIASGVLLRRLARLR
jgi:hypothetical protein